MEVGIRLNLFIWKLWKFKLIVLQQNKQVWLPPLLEKNIPKTEWEGIENKSHWISSVKSDRPWMQFLPSSSPPSWRNDELLQTPESCAWFAFRQSMEVSKMIWRNSLTCQLPFLLDKSLKFSIFLVRKHVTKKTAFLCIWKHPQTVTCITWCS